MTWTIEQLKGACERALAKYFYFSKHTLGIPGLRTHGSRGRARAEKLFCAPDLFNKLGFAEDISALIIQYFKNGISAAHVHSFGNYLYRELAQESTRDPYCTTFSNYPWELEEQCLARIYQQRDQVHRYLLEDLCALVRSQSWLRQMYPETKLEQVQSLGGKFRQSLACKLLSVPSEGRRSQLLISYQQIRSYIEASFHTDLGMWLEIAEDACNYLLGKQTKIFHLLTPGMAGTLLQRWHNFCGPTKEPIMIPSRPR